MEIVEKFYFRDTDHSLMLLLKTSSYLAKFSIESHRQCCESFGINVSIPGKERGFSTTDELRSLIGMRFISLKYDHARCTADYYDHDEGYDDGGMVAFKLALEDIVTGAANNVKIDIFNQHNGYYAHEFSVDAFGIKDTGSI